MELSALMLMALVLLALAAFTVLAGFAAYRLWKMDWTMEKKPTRAAFEAPDAAPAGPAPAKAAPPLPPTEVELDSATEPSQSTAPPKVFAPPSPHEIAAVESEGGFGKAARMWRLRGDLVRERSALRRAGEPGRLGEVEAALGDPVAAAEHFRAALDEDAYDEGVRLRLIQCLLDIGEPEEAARLAAKAAGAQATPRFLSRAARAFEAAGHTEKALGLYEKAADLADSDAPLPEAAIRADYLREIKRLLAIPRSSNGTGVTDLIQAATMTESTPGINSLELLQPDDRLPPMQRPDGPLRFEVLVGHPALGGLHEEPGHSVRSAASIPTRFHLNKLVAAGANSAVFLGKDALLDYPVALRIVRVEFTEGEYKNLRRRLHAISRINHPHIAKLTYADRVGDVLRVAHDYQAGGSLSTLVAGNGPLGLPIALRILSMSVAGIEAAHRAGVVHGDLRASNILIGHDNLVKLVDFAIEPWPVRSGRVEDPRTPSRPQALDSEEIQSDILQFAEIIGFVADSTTISEGMMERLKGLEPLAELKELRLSAERGAFSGVAQIRRVLQDLSERIAPAFR